MRSEGAMQQHREKMAAMRRQMLWVHYLVIALGVWLLTSPFQFGLFDGGGVQTVRDITAEPRSCSDSDRASALVGRSGFGRAAGISSSPSRLLLPGVGTDRSGVWSLHGGSSYAGCAARRRQHRT